MPQPNSENRVPLEILLPAMQRLSQSQRTFLARYLSNGHDAQDATRIAFPRCKLAKAIQIRGLQVLGRKSVRRVLAIHCGQNNSELNLELALTDTRRLVKRALRRNRNVGNDALVVSLNRMSKTLASIAREKSDG